MILTNKYLQHVLKIHEQVPILKSGDLLDSLKYFEPWLKIQGEIQQDWGLERCLMDLPSIGQRLFGNRKLNDNKEKSLGIQDLNAITKSFKDGRRHGAQKVIWQVDLRAIYTDINPREVLLRTSYGAFPQNVWVTVRLNDYPEIYTCAAGTMIKVSGQIQSIQGEDIYLENCQLEFLS